MIDYIGSDRRTARRSVRGHIRRHLGFTTDHFAVGQTVDLRGANWNTAERATRRPPKPIGWQLGHDKTTDSVQHMAQTMQTWTPRWEMTVFKEMLERAIL